MSREFDRETLTDYEQGFLSLEIHEKTEFSKTFNLVLRIFRRILVDMKTTGKN